MIFERISAARINPVPWNPRVDLQPGDPAFEKIRRSIDEFGMVEPLVWNKRTGNLLGGHQRFKILAAAGHTQIDVSVVDLPSEKERALNLALNKIGGSWDEGKLGSLLGELVGTPDFNIELTGFDVSEVDELLASLASKDLQNKDETFDVAQALQATGTPVTQPGEIIELGQHRLMCADSKSPEDVAKLMAGQRAQLVVTDPPYGTDAGGEESPAAGVNRMRRTGSMPWDKLGRAAYLKLLVAALGNAHEVADEKSSLYVWFPALRMRQVLDTLTATKWKERNLIVWRKDRISSWLHGNYKYQYELCYYAHKQGQSPRWFGPSNASTIWECARPPKVEGHATPKPLELIERAIVNSSKAGEIVLDLFVGSGTTIIAAAKTGRRCFAMEISPTYCDLAVRRHIEFVGVSGVAPAIVDRYRQPEEPSR